MRGAALALVLAVIAPGCSERGAPPASSGPPRLTTVQGTLVAQSLPDEGDAIVELRDATSTDGPIVAEQRIALRGAQPPIRFTLTVDPGRLRADATYTVRGAIQEKGRRPILLSDVLPVDPMMESVDLGELTMKVHMTLTSATTLRCGDRGEIQFGVFDNAMHIMIGDESVPLRPVAGGPGGRYEAPNDRTTTFTITGDRALFVVRGEAWPECVPVQKPEPAR